MKNAITGRSQMTREERQGFLEEELRHRTRQWLVEMINEELDTALGLSHHQRGEGRQGYRNGQRERSFTTSGGKYEITFPRAVLFEPDASGKREWNSRLIPRYARRSETVEQAIINGYLCGTNTRKIKQALSPLLAGAELSKSTVSRIVGRLSEHFEVWRKRDLSAEDIAVLFLDGFNLKLRLMRKVESIPVLSAIGVRPDGTKVLLSLELRSSESEAAWSAVTEDLAGRGVKMPILAVIDGNGGLYNSVKSTWPWIDVQRCTKHKLENLYTHCPRRHYEEVKADYHAIVYAESRKQAQGAYRRFEKKWAKSCPGLVKSLHEGGEELLTFFSYPKQMRRSIRTTNFIESINKEFRRRVKTQGSLPNSDAGLKLLYALFAFGLIKTNRICGCRELGPFVANRREQLGLIKKLDKAA